MEKQHIDIDAWFSSLIGDEKTVHPFHEKAREQARSFRRFSNTVYYHMPYLVESAIGQYLYEFSKHINIQYKPSRKLFDREGAAYVAKRGSRKPGYILYGEFCNAAIVGHEIRHATQHLTLPTDLLNPSSAEEQILLDRFIEADARAIGFGITLQIVHELKLSNDYAFHLLGYLDDHEKEICDYSYEKLNVICASPKKLKQAMRNVFDWWIAHGPQLHGSYDKDTENTLKMAQASKLYRAFFNSRNKDKDKLLATPCYDRTGIDPAYVEERNPLASSDNMEGNYLTETKGPSFTDEFYTRPCQYRLEREAETLKNRLG